MNTPLQIHQREHLRAVQLKQLGILCEIDRICRKAGIDYWLDGGTLLGAVRHGGFIPWDDDIDIAMRLADLPRFVEAARRELPPHLLMQTPDTDRDVRMPIFKVRDTNSFLVEAADDFTRGYAKGLYVDIFPMMPYPAFSRRFVKRIAKGYCRANAILNSQHYYSLRSTAEFFYFGIKPPSGTSVRCFSIKRSTSPTRSTTTATASCTAPPTSSPFRKSPSRARPSAPPPRPTIICKTFIRTT